MILHMPSSAHYVQSGCIPSICINASVSYRFHTQVLRKSSTHYGKALLFMRESGSATECVWKCLALKVLIRNKHGQIQFFSNPMYLQRKAEGHFARKALEKGNETTGTETRTEVTTSVLSSSSESKHSQEQLDGSTSPGNFGNSSIYRELSALECYFRKLYQKANENRAVLSNAQWKSQYLTEATNSERNSANQSALNSTSVVAVGKFTSKQSNGSNIMNGGEHVDLEAREGIELGEMIHKANPNSEHARAISSLYESDGEAELDSKLNADPAYTESYMVYVLAAVNIAVYIFGLATPVETPDMGMSTLPLLFGAKVNELILYGEWWRLITSMFLFSGFIHVALSSWALLVFGPVVERAYGSLAFCMIYFLGGICGDILSFCHTNEATVGGTGPLFAVLSSWIVYLLQNRKLIEEELGDGFMLAILTSAPIIALSCLVPVDIWIHLGAVCAGLMFGNFSCPVGNIRVEAKNLLSRQDNIKRFYVISDRPSWLKLLVIFGISIAVCLGILSLSAPMETQFQEVLDSRTLLRSRLDSASSQKIVVPAPLF